jgi:AraC-like DNA-binding protein
MVKDYREVKYSPSSVHSGHEYINLSFLHKGVNIDISCRILSSGFTDRCESMRFSHPYPPFSRFFIFVEGGAEAIVPSGKIELVKGNIYHLPPNLPFDIRYEVSKLIFFHLHVADFTKQSFFREAKEISEISDADLFSRYLQGCQNSDKMQTFSAIIDTLRIFLNPQIDSIAVQAEQAKHFSLLFNYIQNKPIAQVTIAELAELYSKTPGALSKHFKRTMSISLKKFLLEQQLTQAQELLLHTEKTVTQISEELGHSNSQYFHHFFKKYCSCTPTEYRAIVQS